MAFNFDEHYERVKGEGVEWVVRGKTYTLPPDIPMLFMTALWDDELRDGKAILGTLIHIFGEEDVINWIGEDGMDREEYTALVDKVWQHYFPNAGTVEEGDDSSPKA